MWFGTPVVTIPCSTRNVPCNPRCTIRTRVCTVSGRDGESRCCVHSWGREVSPRYDCPNIRCSCSCRQGTAQSPTVCKTWELFCDYSVIILWLFCDNSVIILWLFCDYSENILRIFCDYSVIILLLFCDYSVIILRLFCHYFDYSFIILWLFWPKKQEPDIFDCLFC